MNGLQHFTTTNSLKFCLALCFSSGPQLLKIWPQLSPGWPQLFSYGERDGDNFFRARANPVVHMMSLGSKMAPLGVTSSKQEQRRKTLKFFFSETRKCRALIFCM